MILNVLWLLLIAYAGAILLLAGCQTRLIFPASRAVMRTPADKGWRYDEVKVPVGEYTTHGWFIPATVPRGTVLFSHGNGGDVDLWLDAMPVYRRLGLNVLLYDFGGYGFSTGGPSEARCYDDIRAMWRYLTEQKNVQPGRIVLVGRSLGTGPTVQLATEVEPAAVVLESPFLSMPKMAQKLFPFLPGKYLVRHKFDNESKIQRIECPLLICHSPTDTLIPYAHARKLYELYQGPKQLAEIRGDHNDCFFICEQEYEAALGAFFDPILGTAPAASTPVLPMGG